MYHKLSSYLGDGDESELYHSAASFALSRTSDLACYTKEGKRRRKVKKPAVQKTPGRQLPQLAGLGKGPSPAAPSTPLLDSLPSSNAHVPKQQPSVNKMPSMVARAARALVASALAQSSTGSSSNAAGAPQRRATRTNHQPTLELPPSTSAPAPGRQTVPASPGQTSDDDGLTRCDTLFSIDTLEEADFGPEVLMASDIPASPQQDEPTPDESRSPLALTHQLLTLHLALLEAGAEGSAQEAQAGSSHVGGGACRINAGKQQCGLPKQSQALQQEVSQDNVEAQLGSRLEAALTAVLEDAPVDAATDACSSVPDTPRPHGSCACSSLDARQGSADEFLGYSSDEGEGSCSQQGTQAAGSATADFNTHQGATGATTTGTTEASSGVEAQPSSVCMTPGASCPPYHQQPSHASSLGDVGVTPAQTRQYKGTAREYTPDSVQYLPMYSSSGASSSSGLRQAGGSIPSPASLADERRALLYDLEGELATVTANRTGEVLAYKNQGFQKSSKQPQSSTVCPSRQHQKQTQGVAFDRSSVLAAGRPATQCPADSRHDADSSEQEEEPVAVLALRESLLQYAVSELQQLEDLLSAVTVKESPDGQEIQQGLLSPEAAEELQASVMGEVLGVVQEAMQHGMSLINTAAELREAQAGPHCQHEWVSALLHSQLSNIGSSLPSVVNRVRASLYGQASNCYGSVPSPTSVRSYATAVSTTSHWAGSSAGTRPNVRQGPPAGKAHQQQVSQGMPSRGSMHHGSSVRSSSRDWPDEFMSCAEDWGSESEGSIISNHPRRRPHKPPHTIQRSTHFTGGVGAPCHTTRQQEQGCLPDPMMMLGGSLEHADEHQLASVLAALQHRQHQQQVGQYATGSSPSYEGGAQSVGEAGSQWPSSMASSAPSPAASSSAAFLAFSQLSQHAYKAAGKQGTRPHAGHNHRYGTGSRQMTQSTFASSSSPSTPPDAFPASAWPGQPATSTQTSPGPHGADSPAPRSSPAWTVTGAPSPESSVAGTPAATPARKLMFRETGRVKRQGREPEHVQHTVGDAKNTGAQLVQQGKADEAIRVPGDVLPPADTPLASIREESVSFMTPLPSAFPAPSPKPQATTGVAAEAFNLAKASAALVSPRETATKETQAPAGSATGEAGKHSKSTRQAQLLTGSGASAAMGTGAITAGGDQQGRAGSATMSRPAGPAPRSNITSAAQVISSAGVPQRPAPPPPGPPPPPPPPATALKAQGSASSLSKPSGIKPPPGPPPPPPIIAVKPPAGVANKGDSPKPPGVPIKPTTLSQQQSTSAAMPAGAPGPPPPPRPPPPPPPPTPAAKSSASTGGPHSLSSLKLVPVSSTSSVGSSTQSSVTRYPRIISLHQELRKALLGPVAQPRTQARAGPAVAAGPDAGGGCGRSELLSEMSQRSRYLQQVSEHAARHAPLLLEWSVRLRTAKLSDMAAVSALVKELDAALEPLCDEPAVIKKWSQGGEGREWPESRCDTLRWAAALWSQLQGFCSALSGWRINPSVPVVQELQRAARYHEAVVRRMDEIMRERDKMSSRFKEADIPWSWGITQEVQHAALTLLHEYLQASMAEAAYLTLTADQAKGNGPAGVSGTGRGQGDSSGQTAPIPQAAVRLLDGAITFAFRMHQFVGGFDAACTQALEQLTPMWKACRQQSGQHAQ